MFRLDTEKDIELLRQAAILLERENKRLTAKVVELTKQLLTAQGKDKQELQQRLALLEQQLASQNKRLYGPSTERRSGEEEEDTSGKEKKPQKGHGPTEQPKLPEVEVTHDLDEADKVCPSCGGDLKEWTGQFEETEEVDVVERRFVRRVHKQKKYRCDCGGCVETAPGPDKLFAGARYTAEVAIEIAIQKYVDHIPLERQVRIFAREGLSVTSQTLWDYIERVARLLEPAYERLRAFILLEPVIGADETRWPVMGKAKESKSWHVWAASSASAIYFLIEDSRSKDAAKELLSGYSGIVMCDGYGVYEALASAQPGLVLAHCWAHVRRKFIDIETAFPEETKEIVGLIRDLYQVERQCRSGPEGDDERRELRGEQSRGIVERILAWVYATYPNTLPEGGLAKAIRYMGGMWTGLVRFLDDPRIPLDNNQTERGLRGPVIGRKNHYGSRSLRGTEVAALFYSLFETAKLVGLDPKEYLRLAVSTANAGQPIPLPHEALSLLQPPAARPATPAP
ncbi:MAG: IS66 family transposase [Polyangiaceae bacterium]